MKTALFTIALAVGVCSIGLAGCATDVEDPVTPAPAGEPQTEPPPQTLSGELRDPQQQLISGIGADRGFRDVPVLQPPRIPTPAPER